MKYIKEDVTVGFREIPGEISLLINITGCWIHCPDCHSKYLWKDKGDELTGEMLTDLINRNPGISCVSFQGGFDPDGLNALARVCRASNLRTAWWTGLSIASVFDGPDMYGRIRFCNELDPALWDYVKTGPYIMVFGGLDCAGTNQCMHRITDVRTDGSFKTEDITYKYRNL